jgi:hypothetical protein
VIVPVHRRRQRTAAFETEICRMTAHEAQEQLIAPLKCVIDGHRLPAAMMACQKSIPRHATTIIRRIRARVWGSKILSFWEVSRSGSFMRNYSVARQRTNLTRP